MKKFFILLLVFILFITPFNIYAEENLDEQQSPELQENIEQVQQENKEELQLIEESSEQTEQSEEEEKQEEEINIEIQEEETNDSESQVEIVAYDYEIGLDNLSKYNIVALNDATINCHVRGSLWVGGTLTGNQYIDDGALNGQAASDSYIYNNMSELYFKSRTQYQGLESYYLLSDKAVTKTRDFWKKILNSLANGDESFIYVQPDENGFVDLRLWNYQAKGGDETKTTIPTVYWTDATSVIMGGLAGHLIAPYADIYIVSCNHCGSIVGWNITTDGEGHINYYTFEKPKPIEKITPTPTPTVTPSPTPTPTITPIPTKTPRPTPTTIRPTPPPHIIPETGDNSFIVPLIIFIFAIIGIVIVLIKRKK